MTGMKEWQNCSQDITQDTTTKTDVLPKKLSAQGNTSCSAHGTVTHCLFGENLKTIAGNKELTVPYSAMRANTNHQTLSGRLTPLLISAGLVRGIIPMSMRVKSNQLILDIVLRPQDGDNAEEQK